LPQAETVDRKERMKTICVIDGQGGGIGSALIRQIKARYGESIEILALGTNAIATAQMLKAKANRGASGENAIVQTVRRVDLILGPIGIIMAHSMMGEVTVPMAERVAIVGAPAIPLPRLIEQLIEEHLVPFLGQGV
jgi:hypothetical protein